MSTTLLPLVVFAGLAACDGRCRDEYILYTDGLRAYGMDGAERIEVQGLAREGSRITAWCPVENCDGYLEWDLTQQEWTGDLTARTMVRDYAEEMELL